MDAWVVEWLSADRIRKYIIAANHDDARALRLYEWNANLNAALLHDFAHFEVGLRNLYDRGLRLSLRPAESHWLEPYPLQRLYPGSGKGNVRSRSDVAGARFRVKVPHPSPGAIMAELTFGFWANITARRLESTTWQYLKRVLPPRTDRQQLHESMVELNKTRNRVAHHEPADTGNVELTLRRMRRIATYVSPDFADYLDTKSKVRSIMAARP